MNCWLLNPDPPPPALRIVIAYIAVTAGPMTDSYLPRFAQTYREQDSGYPHKLVICCNGGELYPRHKEYFKNIDCDFYERANDGGKDISGYQEIASQMAAGNIPGDILVCFGESVFFHRPGWLKRLAEAREQHGPGMYGCFSSHCVRAHLNTTAFLTDARLLVKHPQVRTNQQRYEFEHGGNCYWKRLHAGNNTTAFVSWDGVWMPGDWRKPKNILHTGDQTNLLVHCNHTTRYEQGNEASRVLWTSLSDGPFRV